MAAVEDIIKTKNRKESGGPEQIKERKEFDEIFENADDAYQTSIENGNPKNDPQHIEDVPAEAIATTTATADAIKDGNGRRESFATRQSKAVWQ